jgi:hypothetical protein
MATLLGATVSRETRRLQGHIDRPAKRASHASVCVTRRAKALEDC